MSREETSLYYQADTPVPDTPLPGNAPAPWKKTQVVGKSIPRVDAYERVSGRALYPSDLSLPRMLYGAILRSPYPNARVKKVDTTEAEKMEGVRAVISAATGEAGVYWPYTREKKVKLFDPECRYEGETIAAVAAESPYQAWDAIRAIKVDYEILPFVVDERKALDSKAPPVHPEGNMVKPVEIYERGDPAKGFAQADVVLEQTYRTECEIHTPMETSWMPGPVGAQPPDPLGIDPGCLPGAGTGRRDPRSAALQGTGHRPLHGGGFGSKLQADKYTIIAALLAKKTGRPVKLFLTREETYLAVGNRPPANMKLKAGVKKDGTLTASHFTCTGTGGAFPAGGTGLDRLAGQGVVPVSECPDRAFGRIHQCRPFPALSGARPSSRRLGSGTDDGCPGRGDRDGPGGAAAQEHPDLQPGRKGNPPYTTTGFKECLEEGAKAFSWDEARKEIAQTPKKAKFAGESVWPAAPGLSGGGDPPSTVIVRLFSDGSVNLNMGASDIGTGTKTVMALVVAEELGVKPEVIQIEHADTGTTQYATASGGSKTVPTESPAVRAAAIEVKQQILQLAAEDLKTDPSGLTLMARRRSSDGNDPSKKIKITDIPRAQDPGGGCRHRLPGLPTPGTNRSTPFAAQFCEVECNMKTGEVQIIRFLSANDSGRVMDRLTYDNQVVGGITMGVGLAMTEMRVLDAEPDRKDGQQELA